MTNHQTFNSSQIPSPVSKMSKQGQDEASTHCEKQVAETSEERRRQLNRRAQKAFRERRTEHMAYLEKAMEQMKKDLHASQVARAGAVEELMMMKYKNSLLERLLLEKGIDVHKELNRPQGQRSHKRSRRDPETSTSQRKRPLPPAFDEESNNTRRNPHISSTQQIRHRSTHKTIQSPPPNQVTQVTQHQCHCPSNPNEHPTWKPHSPGKYLSLYIIPYLKNYLVLD